MVVAESFDDDWTLTVGGTEISPDLSFGWAMRYSSPAEGTAQLSYSRPWSITLQIAAQLLALAVMLRIALAEQGVRRRVARARESVA